MTRCDARRRRGAAWALATPRRPASKGASRPAFDRLEGRLLLSTASTFHDLSYQQASYVVAVVGPGEVHVRKSGAGFAIDLSGTTTASTLTVSQVSTKPKYNGSLLPVAAINVRSGLLGQVSGRGAVDLVGSIQTSGAVRSILLGAVGPAATINAKGGLGSLGVAGAIDLGPGGRIHVAGDLAGGLQAGSIRLAGGQIRVDHNLGGLASGPISVTGNGRFSVGNDAAALRINGDAYLAGGGSLDVGEDTTGLGLIGNLTIAPGGRIALGRDVIGPVSLGGSVTLDAGQVLVGRDLTGSLTVNGNLAAGHGGNLTVGRDLGGLTVNGNLGLGSGGFLGIGRNVVAGLSVGGSLSTAGGGTISVGGNLVGLDVTGIIAGQGTAAIDLSVGLDLSNWSVRGGAAGLGGVNRFNASVAKNIQGLTVLHGLFHDFVTAGVLITNGSVGADGPVAVFDTEIRAGVQITNTTFSGDVVSDRPTNPAGELTRIVAGEDRSGNFEVGGNMENVIIAGSLIDAVLAASVQPFGGDGSIVVTPAPAPPDGSQGTYDAPAGGIYLAPALGGSNLGIPYAAPPFDKQLDPNVRDRVLPGSINRGFAPSSTSTARPKVPTRSTVDGGVITTSHANGSDYAGIFAADTSGVFVGSLPG